MDCFAVDASFARHDACLFGSSASFSWLDACSASPWPCRIASSTDVPVAQVGVLPYAWPEIWKKHTSQTATTETTDTLLH